jgi:hypothetical protein
MARRQRRRGGALRAVLTATAMCLLLVPLLGLAWWIVAPTPQAIVRDGGVLLADPETSAFIAADGWFAILGALAGLLAAVLVMLGSRKRGVAALVGLTVGGVLASLLAWRVGHLLGPGELLPRARSADEGSTLEGPLDLRASGVLFAWPMAAVAAFLSLTAGVEPPPHLTGADRRDDSGLRTASV